MMLFASPLAKFTGMSDESAQAGGTTEVRMMLLLIKWGVVSTVKAIQVGPYDATCKANRVKHPQQKE